ncbi:MAG: hypothetical protein M0C28_24830 [Candidatus Moduliflexus flocculans]|nr:hypothetical protein [Candidatus Moduliflexus flocculans]
MDNGVGWYLAGFIEDRNGALRPQNREELAQCIGCHSGVASTEFPLFTSGVGNTVDSTWSLPRKFPGELGWREMDYLRYLARADARPQATPGQARLGDPLNRELNQGEFRHFSRQRGGREPVWGHAHRHRTLSGRRDPACQWLFRRLAGAGYRQCGGLPAESRRRGKRCCAS